MDLQKLKSLAKAATQGPWRWELNESSKSVAIVGGRPTFDKIVMDFVRWGMGHAAPRFNDAVAEGKYNVMERVEKYGATVPGREHHADWFKDVAHPDAAFIVVANPQTVLYLIEEVERLQRDVSALLSAPSRDAQEAKQIGREPTDAMQAAGAQAIRFDTTLLNKMWTANAVFRAMWDAALSAQANQNQGEKVNEAH